MVINTEINNTYNSETSNNSACRNNSCNNNDKKNNTYYKGDTTKCVVKIKQYMGLSIQEWTKHNLFKTAFKNLK